MLLTSEMAAKLVDYAAEHHGARVYPDQRERCAALLQRRWAQMPTSPPIEPEFWVAAISATAQL